MTGPHGQPADPQLSELNDSQVIELMAHCLSLRQLHMVGTRPWAAAVLRYEECKREMDRRVIEHIVQAVRERDGE